MSEHSVADMGAVGNLRLARGPSYRSVEIRGNRTATQNIFIKPRRHLFDTWNPDRVGNS